MSGRHHVVHVIGTLRTGGAERQLTNYLLAANQGEFRHTALCLTARGDFAPLIEDAGIPVVVRRVRNRRFPIDLVSFARWMRRENVHVVHTHMHGAALWGRLAGMLAGVPVLVTTEHGMELWKKPHQVALDHCLSHWTWRHLAVSQDGLDIRLRRERVRPERMELVPNGVPIPDLGVRDRVNAQVRAELGIDPARPLVGSVGRVVEAKAYPDLLGAVSILREEHADICWLQIGDGPLAGDLATAVKERGLEENVILAGNRSDVGALLQALDVWVMSSIREGLPMALLEAMAAALPIVGTRVGGIPEAVEHEESALLVAPGSPPEMATAIARLLDEAPLADRLARSARKRAVAAYSIEAVAARIEDIYRAGLQRHGVGLT